MKARAYSKDQERQDALLGNFVSFQKERVVTFAKEESPRLTLVPYAPTGLGNFKMAGPFPVSSPVTGTRSRKGGRVWTTAQHGTNPRGTPTRDGDLSAQSACPGGTGCTACHPGRLQAREKRRPRRSSAETRVDTNLSDVLQSPLLQELACHLLPEKSPLGVSMLFTMRLPPRC